MVVWLLVGIPIGIISAIRRGRIEDRIAMGGALIAISAPVYWLGLVALYLFSKDIGQIPIFDGAGSYPNTGSLFNDPIHVAPTLFLPWLVLAASFAAIYARFLRGNLLETMSEDYIRTARAKGLTEKRVVLKHGLRAGLTPIVTVFGLDLAALLGGAIITESIFNLPGIGQLTVQAVGGQDLNTIAVITLVAAVFVVVANLVVDILYAFLDPRVRFE
jgi:peptide/nickel transport system permease protein